MNVLDKVEKTLEAEKIAAESSYRKLVTRLATNAEVPEAEVTATLKASGRKPSEMRADIEREQRCNVLREKIKGNKAAITRLRKAQAAKADFHARQQRSFKDFRDEQVKVVTELNQAQAAFTSIGKAADELAELTGEQVLLPDDDDEAESPKETPAPTVRKSKRS